MSKPLEKIIKEYASRGPLRQYRFERSIAFTCFRCGQAKTAKLITTYGDVWSKRLCNGCYGRLISIYQIKNNAGDLDEKVELLSKILSELIDKRQLEDQKQRVLLKDNQVGCLSDSSLRFFATSEFVANTLVNEPSLDWSPAVIGICKAFELEIIERLIEPLKLSSLQYASERTDLLDKDFGRVVSYCYGKSVKPPELGVIGHFIKTVINSKSRIETSSFLRECFKPFLQNKPNSSWLVDKDGLASSIEILTRNYRNKAAHIEELGRKDYEDCKNLVFGQDGIMWHLVVSTQRIK